MCLAIPGRVVEIVDGTAGQLAQVDVMGVCRPINLGMLEEPAVPGDWVMIHMGFAMSVVDEAEADRARSGLELMGRPLPADEHGELH
jgi:hydrogenase assembly chaperone HypC/HupF